MRMLCYSMRVTVMLQPLNSPKHAETATNERQAAVVSMHAGNAVEGFVNSFTSAAAP